MLMGGRLISKFATLLINVDLQWGVWRRSTLSFSDTAFTKKMSFSSKNSKTHNGTERQNGLFTAQQVRPGTHFIILARIILTQNLSSLSHFKVGLNFRVIEHCFSVAYSCEWVPIICSRPAIRRSDEFLTCHKIWIGRLRLSHSRNTAMSRFGIRTPIATLIWLMTLAVKLTTVKVARLPPILSAKCTSYTISYKIFASLYVLASLILEVVAHRIAKITKAARFCLVCRASELSNDSLLRVVNWQVIQQELMGLSTHTMWTHK